MLESPMHTCPATAGSSLSSLAQDLVRLLCMTVICTICCRGVAIGSPQPADEGALITVRSDLALARVRIDGHLEGPVPATIAVLPGEHLVEVEPFGHDDSSRRPWRCRSVFKPGEKAELFASFRGQKRSPKWADLDIANRSRIEGDWWAAISAWQKLVDTFPGSCEAREARSLISRHEPLLGHLAIEPEPPLPHGEVWIDYRRKVPLPFSEPMAPGGHILSIRDEKGRFYESCHLTVVPGKTHLYVPRPGEPENRIPQRAALYREAEIAFSDARYQAALSGWARVQELYSSSCEALAAAERRRRLQALSDGRGAWESHQAANGVPSFVGILASPESAAITTPRYEAQSTPFATAIQALFLPIRAGASGYRSQECLLRLVPGEDLRLRIALLPTGSAGPSRAQELFEGADRALELGRLGRAVRLWTELFSQFPRSCEAIRAAPIASTFVPRLFPPSKLRAAATKPAAIRPSGPEDMVDKGVRAALVTIEVKSHPGWKCRRGSEPLLYIELGGRSCLVPLDRSWSSEPIPFCGPVAAGNTELSAQFVSGRTNGPSCTGRVRQTVELDPQVTTKLVFEIKDLHCPRLVPFAEPWCSLQVGIEN